MLISPSLSDNSSTTTIQTEPVDLDSIWEQAQSCREHEDFFNSREKESPTVIAKLPCGDIHICGKQRFCPYLEVNDVMIIC